MVCRSLRRTRSIKSTACAIYIIIWHGSQRGNVCNNAHSCRLQSVCDIRHYHIWCGKTKCVWLSTHRTRFIIMNCLWCARHVKLPCLESAWKTPVPGICLVLGRTTKLRLRWQCEHKRVTRMKRLGYSKYQKRLYMDNCTHQGSLSPMVSGSCGKDPPITHTRRRFEMPSRKGVKNRLFRTDAHQWHGKIQTDGSKLWVSP